MKDKQRINITDHQIYKGLEAAKLAAKSYKSMFNSNNKGLKIKIWYKNENGDLSLLFLLVNPRKVGKKGKFEQPTNAPFSD